jgi:hypothetical protein
MGKYKIENSEFTFDVDDLLPDYGEISKFPIRPNGVEGLAEILFQITEQRMGIPEDTALVIYETGSYQYVISSGPKYRLDDVYLTIYKIYENALRVYLVSKIVGVAYLEDMIINHISEHNEWVGV